jgi:hypothetical protein
MLCVVEHGPSENVGLASFSFACDTGGPRVRPPFGKAINYIYIYTYLLSLVVFELSLSSLLLYIYMHIYICMYLRLCIRV